MSIEVAHRISQLQDVGSDKIRKEDDVHGLQQMLWSSGNSGCEGCDDGNNNGRDHPTEYCNLDV